ncbi:MAG TPA: ligase-associated DNA damage response exonuclease [Hyphomicrobiaceae bacterium]|nr:ligase-associated DNA damage response exonuclease [Hyphomicrobiaceae bacterium]
MAVPENWLYPTPRGLYCAPGDFYVDPHRPVARAVVTHGHSDHARGGHEAVLATQPTINIMRIRMGDGAAACFQELSYGEALRIGEVDVSLHPAGHILGSAQIAISYRGYRAVVSGDYKREADPTCAAFELQRCDLFVTEATFGLPVFRHEPMGREIDRLVTSAGRFPERTHLVGAYGLGKCQRVIRGLRDAGYTKPIWLHGAMRKLCAFYENSGVELGELRPVMDASPDQEKLAGEIVMCPPSALADKWSRRFAEPLTAFASGWMRVRGRARQRGVELPLVISDHADWPGLVKTISETGAAEVWVTHGREAALVRQLDLMGIRGRALALVGREEEGE